MWVTKFWANHLSKVLPSVISPNQCAFVPGRVITDHIIIGQELFHHLKNRRYGRVHDVAIKLDMSKPYEMTVEWIFLEKIMLKLGFHLKWVGWINECWRLFLFQFCLMDRFRDIFSHPGGCVRATHYLRFCFFCAGKDCQLCYGNERKTGV